MYEQWQKLKCIVIKHLVNGTYEVLIDEENKIARLVCAEPLTEGEEVIGIFAKDYPGGTCLLSMHEADFH